MDAFTIMRIAGHSSITISQKYVHPTPESLERAFEKLEALNGPEKGEGGTRRAHEVPEPSSTSELKLLSRLHRGPQLTVLEGAATSQSVGRWFEIHQAHYLFTYNPALRPARRTAVLLNSLSGSREPSGE